MTELLTRPPNRVQTPCPPVDEADLPGQPAGPRRILVAVDSTPASRAILATAIATALEGSNVLTIVSASSSEAPIGWTAMCWAIPVCHNQLREDAIASAEANLEWACDLVPCGILVTTRVVTDVGRRRALVCEARSGRHHAVVVGPSGRGWIRAVIDRWHQRRLKRCGIKLIVADG